MAGKGRRMGVETMSKSEDLTLALLLLVVGCWVLWGFGVAMLAGAGLCLVMAFANCIVKMMRD